MCLATLSDEILRVNFSPSLFLFLSSLSREVECRDKVLMVSLNWNIWAFFFRDKAKTTLVNEGSNLSITRR